MTVVFLARRWDGQFCTMKHFELDKRRTVQSEDCIGQSNSVFSVRGPWINVPVQSKENRVSISCVVDHENVHESEYGASIVFQRSLHRLAPHLHPWRW